jgi:hypothetical protein
MDGICEKMDGINMIIKLVEVYLSENIYLALHDEIRKQVLS